MSRPKSQLNSSLDERTGTAKSHRSQLNTTPIASTSTHNSYKSAFFNFMRDFRQTHKRKDFRYLMRLGSRRWRTMNQTDRIPYILEAARNRRNAKSSKKQDTKGKEKNAEKKCPSCKHRKSSRSPLPKKTERSRSRNDSSGGSSHSHSGSSKSRSSKSSSRSKK